MALSKFYLDCDDFKVSTMWVSHFLLVFSNVWFLNNNESLVKSYQKTWPISEKTLQNTLTLSSALTPIKTLSIIPKPRTVPNIPSATSWHNTFNTNAFWIDRLISILYIVHIYVSRLKLSADYLWIGISPFLMIMIETWYPMIKIYGKQSCAPS